MTPTFTVIVPSKGRPTLSRTLAAVAPQLRDGDEIIVVRRDDDPWGNGARDHAISKATTSHLVFIDDDDVHTEGALDEMRLAATESPGSLHIFRMQGVIDGNPWRSPVIQLGNVATPMVVVPNIEDPPLWAAGNAINDGASSDYTWIERVAYRVGDVRWHEQTVALIRP